MLDAKKIDKILFEIIETRLALEGLDYSDSKYDELEDHLHEVEDEFLEEHGEELEKILESVYDQFCPASSVLSPLSYVAQEYIKLGENKNGAIYDVSPEEGVPVQVEKLLHKQTKIVLLPNPLRFVMNIDETNRYDVWVVGKK